MYNWFTFVAICCQSIRNNMLIVLCYEHLIALYYEYFFWWTTLDELHVEHLYQACPVMHLVELSPSLTNISPMFLTFQMK